MTAAGVLAAVGAASCFEVGYALQALEARRAPRVPAPHPGLLGRLARRPRWLAATALTTGGAGLQLLALTLAPLTIVQPTLAIGLLALLVLARVLLGEEPGPREVVAVLAVVTGVIAVALAGPDRVGREPAGTGLAIELAALALVACAPFVLGSAARIAVAGAAAGDVVAALALKLAADELHRGRAPAALAWLVAAALGGLAALTAEMAAIQRLPATRVAPVIVAFQVLVPVATAPALLGEGWGGTPLHGGVLVAAIALVIAGAATLSGSAVLADVLDPGAPAEALEHDGGSGGQLRE